MKCLEVEKLATSGLGISLPGRLVSEDKKGGRKIVSLPSARLAAFKILPSIYIIDQIGQPLCSAVDIPLPYLLLTIILQSQCFPSL